MTAHTHLRPDPHERYGKHIPDLVKKKTMKSRVLSSLRKAVRMCQIFLGFKTSHETVRSSWLRPHNTWGSSRVSRQWSLVFWQQTIQTSPCTYVWRGIQRASWTLIPCGSKSSQPSWRHDQGNWFWVFWHGCVPHTGRNTDDAITSQRNHNPDMVCHTWGRVKVPMCAPDIYLPSWVRYQASRH